MYALRDGGLAVRKLHVRHERHHRIEGRASWEVTPVAQGC
jgi:hypothetical protein